MSLLKTASLVIAIAFVAIQFAVVCGESGNEMRNAGNSQIYRIRMSFDGKETIVRLYDHSTNRVLLSLLPMTLNFKDYIGKEKIAYLPKKLSSDGSSPIGNGDFAYYAPWGNLAIFYQGSERAGGGLIVLGTIESGKSNLASMQSDFIMTLERID